MNPMSDAADIKQKRIFELFTVEEIQTILVQLNRLRHQWPGYRDDELLMYELLCIAKLK